jgi:hypothetical protein
VTILLILCQRADPVAERFAAHAGGRGLRCVLAHDAWHLAITAEARRDGQIMASIRVPGEEGMVGAVFNRAYPQDIGSGDFQAAEWFAAWWSILAVLPRPVLNRPTRAGWRPLLDPLQLCQAVPGVHPAAGLLHAAPARRHATTNGRRPDAAVAQGATNKVTIPPGGDIELSKQAQPTLRILVAGHHLFNLDSSTGELAPAEAERLAPLVAELRRREARFCTVSLACAGSDLTLVNASVFPQLSQFAPCERAVYDALLEYLDG